MVIRCLLALAAAPLLSLGAAVPAQAHPHIFIDAKARIVFDDAGALIAIKNSWTFDEAFSVWQIQGLDTNEDGTVSSEEMQDLANENLAGLADYGFYTSAGEGTLSLPFKAAGTARFVFENNHSTLTFGIEPEGAYRIRDKLEIAIADPEYYVGITFPNVVDVTLENAPAGCIASLKPGHEMPDNLAAQLSVLPPDVTKLPPDLEAALRGVQGSILIDCSAAVGAVAPPPPATALEAVTQMAEAMPTPPAGSPSTQPDVALPSDGMFGFGWIPELLIAFGVLALTFGFVVLRIRA